MLDQELKSARQPNQFYQLLSVLSEAPGDNFPQLVVESLGRMLESPLVILAVNMNGRLQPLAEVGFGQGGCTCPSPEQPLIARLLAEETSWDNDSDDVLPLPLQEAGVCHLFSVPITIEKGGFLMACRLDDRKFTRQDRLAVRLVAKRLAAEISLAESRSHQHFLLEGLRRVAELSPAITGELREEEIIDKAVKVAAEIFGLPVIALALLEEDSGEFVVKAGVGLDTAAFNVDLRQNDIEQITALAVSTGRVVSRENLSSLAGASSDRLGSVMLVPINCGGRVRAVLYLADWKHYSFSEEEERLGEVLAAHIGVALQNAVLHGKALYNAAVDPLTNTLNHGALLTRLEKEIERAKRTGSPLSVLFVDIDNFKVFNDSYGHQFGDVVLKGVAHNLQQSVRSYDVIGRYGGEEFVIICPNLPGEQAAEVANRICLAVANTVYTLPSGKRVSVTVSIGTASSPPLDLNSWRLLGLADSAMYRAKEQGGNCVV